LNSVKLSST